MIFVFKNSSQSSCYPDIRKRSNIIPAHKISDKQLVNYWLVSLLPIKSSNSLAYISYSESIIWSKLIWALSVASQNLSYRSCDNVKAILDAMFPGIIPGPYSMSSSQISHLISEAVGPSYNLLNKMGRKAAHCLLFIMMKQLRNRWKTIWH